MCTHSNKSKDFTLDCSVHYCMYVLYCANIYNLDFHIYRSRCNHTLLMREQEEMAALAHLWIWLGQVLDLDPSLLAFFWLRLLSVKQSTNALVTNLLGSTDQCEIHRYTTRLRKIMRTCSSQPWTAVCNHQRASGSSPWKASERCRWGRGWSCEHKRNRRSMLNLKNTKIITVQESFGLEKEREQQQLTSSEQALTTNTHRVMSPTIRRVHSVTRCKYLHTLQAIVWTILSWHCIRPV